MAKRTARLFGLESALRPRGRPGKERKEGANDAKQPKKQPVPRYVGFGLRRSCFFSLCRITSEGIGHF